MKKVIKYFKTVVYIHSSPHKYISIVFIYIKKEKRKENKSVYRLIPLYEARLSTNKNNQHLMHCNASPLDNRSSLSKVTFNGKNKKAISQTKNILHRLVKEGKN